MKVYLITVSDEKGRFKTYTKKSRKDVFDILNDIEMGGELYVEDVEIIDEEIEEQKKDCKNCTDCDCTDCDPDYDKLFHNNEDYDNEKTTKETEL